MVMYTDETIAAFTNELKTLLSQWGYSGQAEVKLLTISENATFLVTDADSNKNAVFRVHRPAYHTITEIESELQWIKDLRATNTVDTPEPLAKTDGTYIATFTYEGEEFAVVSFAFMDGQEPRPSDPLEEGFVILGAISARLHKHAQTWNFPANFQRKTWDYDAALGTIAYWGDWRDARGLDAEGIAIIEQACAKIKHNLEAYGQTKDNFGLIHADLRLANLLIKGEQLGVIDFDDCGIGWFMYDFASAISFFEESPEIPKLQRSWLEGYKKERDLSQADEDMLATFIMYRRILLTAWLGSHSETPTAEEFGDGYAKTTVQLCKNYLKS